jgi:hypothetical protein
MSYTPSSEPTAHPGTRNNGQMAHQPQRPFESLEWYRQAARRGFAEDERGIDIVQAVTGFTFLRAHVSVYAVTIVTLAVINLLRTPEDIWADRAIMAWTVLLLIHAVGTGTIWAVRQWNADDLEEPLRVDPSAWRQSAMFAWGAPGAAAPEPQDVPYRVTDGQKDDEEETQVVSTWNDWARAAATPPPPPGERASWSEASAAAWLERRSQATPPPVSPPRGEPEA